MDDPVDEESSFASSIAFQNRGCHPFNEIVKIGAKHAITMTIIRPRAFLSVKTRGSNASHFSSLPPSYDFLSPVKYPFVS